MIFLDNAATTFKKPMQVYRAINNAMQSCASVGRGSYAESHAAASKVLDCRLELQKLFNLPDPSCVAFTYNATVALNMAIKGFLHDGAKVLISGYEHNAVVRPLEALCERRIKYSHVVSPLFEPEKLIEGFKSAIPKGIDAVICNHVSNVFGYILPIYELDELCASHGIPMIIDASQSAGIIPIDVQKFKAVKFICMPGHKGLFGPQGTGVLISLNGGDASTIIEGGTGSDSASPIQPSYMPDKFESGTHNVAGIAGLCEGIRFVRREGLDRIRKHEHTLISQAAHGLEKTGNFDIFYTSDQNLQSGVLSFIPRSVTPEHFAELMASSGISLRAGLHCAPLAHRTAGTFSTGTVRLSVSPLNTHRDIDRFLAVARTIR